MKRKVQIEGMSCNHCVAHVKEALIALKDIEVVEVSLEEKYALITGDASEQSIKNAIDEAGYDVVSIDEA